MTEKQYDEVKDLVITAYDKWERLLDLRRWWDIRVSVERGPGAKADPDDEFTRSAKVSVPVGIQVCSYHVLRGRYGVLDSFRVR